MYFIPPIYFLPLIQGTVTQSKTDTTAPVALLRTYKVGEKCVYNVSGNIHVEENQLGLKTFLVNDQDVSYTFYTKIDSVESGNAVMSYFRPTITEVLDDGQSIEPKKTVSKLNETLKLTMSPINEILEVTDLTPKEPKKPAKKASSENFTSLSMNRAKLAPQLDPIVGQFVAGVEQLSIFIGGGGSSLDFCPSFDLNPVKIGSTWARTVGYQPQDLADSKKKVKSVVQRLDLKYQYDGPSTWENKPVLMVSATLTLKTDLSKYLNDTYGVTSEETHLNKFPLDLTEEIHFYLDPMTKQTLYATVASKGGFSIYATDETDALIIQKITGTNAMRMVKKTESEMSEKD